MAIAACRDGGSIPRYPNGRKSAIRPTGHGEIGLVVSIMRGR